jgi:hypothetical protein
MGQLDGKTALVAGAGRNNGKAIALGGMASVTSQPIRAHVIASDQSSYVTGDRILCAGGKYM